MRHEADLFIPVICFLLGAMLGMLIAPPNEPTLEARAREVCGATK